MFYSTNNWLFSRLRFGALVQVSFFILIATISQASLTVLESLGKEIFEDKNLSEPVGQSCSSCHIPEQGFANNEMVFAGANPLLFGNRNTPSIAYASFSPPYKYDTVEGNIVPVGGQFLDGRADNLKHQVIGPFLNPLEMGNKLPDDVINKIKQASYWGKFQQVLHLNKTTTNKQIFEKIISAIVAYEQSDELVKFSSKYDYWLQGKVTFTSLEILGFTIFERLDKGNCAACHTLKKQHKDDNPLLTDFTYDNIGVPANPNNPYYKNPKKYNPQAHKYIDYGLGKSPRMKDAQYLGMFKVPTLRNIELTAPYMHNGVFTSLKEVVEFYNSRDMESKWGKPEVPYNVNNQELGDLKLTEIDMDALVAFMLTLTDGYEYEK